MEFNGLKYLVVGAGFFGAVIAERIAADLGEKVVIIDKRSHLGGNSYSEIDPETGIECHRYGSHIFHTSSEAVWNYVSRFARFNSYRHKVLTTHCERVFQMPINLSTIEAFYGERFTPAQGRMLIEKEVAREGFLAPCNLEEKAISLIGRPLYQALIRGYTEKQWATDPSRLPADIITRLPVRYNYQSDYFNDPWQGIPVDGYHALFEKVLQHPNVEVLLNTDFFAMRDLIPSGCVVVFTGPIDRFFDYRFGALGWRTLRFEKEVCPVGDFQGTAVMNYADLSVPFTRIHEFRHYHEERQYPVDRTVIYREYSTGATNATDPYYPINCAEDQELLRRYQGEADRIPGVVFGGRLGGYRYLDMDQTIAGALHLYREKIKKGAAR